MGRGAASTGHIGLPRSSDHGSSDLLAYGLFAEFGNRPHTLRFVVALLRSASSAYRSLPKKLIKICQEKILEKV